MSRLPAFGRSIDTNAPAFIEKAFSAENMNWFKSAFVHSTFQEKT